MPNIVEFGHRILGENAKNDDSRVFWFPLRSRHDLSICIAFLSSSPPYVDSFLCICSKVTSCRLAGSLVGGGGLIGPLVTSLVGHRRRRREHAYESALAELALHPCAPVTNDILRRNYYQIEMLFFTLHSSYATQLSFNLIQEA